MGAAMTKETIGTIFHCVDVGMGQVAKLANNAVGMGTAAVLMEASRMARSSSSTTPRHWG